MFIDRTALRTTAYGDRRPLAARVAIYRWQQDPVDLPGLALAALAGVGGAVLDAGCGLGTYVDQLLAGAVHDLTGATIEVPDTDGRFTPGEAGLLRARGGRRDRPAWRLAAGQPGRRPHLSLSATSGR